MKKTEFTTAEIKHNHPVSTAVAIILLVLYFGFVIFLLAHMEEPPSAIAMFVLVLGAVAVYFVPLGVRSLYRHVAKSVKVEIK